MYRRYVKRIIDVILALTGLILASWLYLLIMITIEIDDPGPVLFRQKRVGIHKTHFSVVKFRTMKMDTPHDVPTDQLEHADQYITPLGKFLRKSSLDELPQIFDILRGDMSFVGPRPALPNQTRLLELRHENGSDQLKPGLFGLAQKNGRDQLLETEKAAYDGEYAEKLSFWMDCKSFFVCIFNSVLQKNIVEGKQSHSTKK